LFSQFDNADLLFRLGLQLEQHFALSFGFQTRIRFVLLPLLLQRPLLLFQPSSLCLDPPQVFLFLSLSGGFSFALQPFLFLRARGLVDQALLVLLQLQLLGVETTFLLLHLSLAFSLLPLPLLFLRFHLPHLILPFRL